MTLTKRQDTYLYVLADDVLLPTASEKICENLDTIAYEEALRSRRPSYASLVLDVDMGALETWKSDKKCNMKESGDAVLRAQSYVYATTWYLDVVELTTIRDHLPSDDSTSCCKNFEREGIQCQLSPS